MLYVIIVNFSKTESRLAFQNVKNIISWQLYHLSHHSQRQGIGTESTVGKYTLLAVRVEQQMQVEQNITIVLVAVLGW